MLSSASVLAQISCTSTFGSLALYLTIRTAFATDVTVATAFRIFRQQAREPRVEVQEIWNKQARYIGFDKCVRANFVAEKLGEKNSTDIRCYINHIYEHRQNNQDQQVNMEQYDRLECFPDNGFP